MYLEISPRRSGKTTRLVNQLIKDIESSHFTTFLVVTAFGKPYYSHIKELLLSRISLKTHVVVKSKSENFIVFESNNRQKFVGFCSDVSKWYKFRGISLEQPKEYYDEFDYIKNVNEKEYNYYCTTSAKLRTYSEIHRQKDIFSKLLISNNFSYTCFLSKFDSDVFDIENVRRSMSYSEFECSILGNFLCYPNSKREQSFDEISGIPISPSSRFIQE